MGHPFGFGCAKRKKDNSRSLRDDHKKGNSKGKGDSRFLHSAAECAAFGRNDVVWGVVGCWQEGMATANATAIGIGFRESGYGGCARTSGDDACCCGVDGQA
jgi:hypothetical protein